MRVGEVTRTARDTQARPFDIPSVRGPAVFQHRVEYEISRSGYRTEKRVAYVEPGKSDTVRRSARPRMSRCLRLLIVLGLWVPGITLAADWVDEEVPALRATYEYGHYAEVLERATSRIDRGRLSEQDLLELHKLAGLSAFHLHHTDEATRHFRALLRLDPDFHLDPFAVPPPAVNFLDTLREQMGEELERVRQERRARQERERAEAERRERERVEAEEQRRRMEELSRQVTVRLVEKRSLLVNFVPFGAGQFQQGRTGMGALFAATEGLLAATSLATYFAHRGALQDGEGVGG
ncbi:hypothetical protein ACN28S_27385 [Cystobacter fuscus]